MTRTHKKWIRVYISGYDMSGYLRDVGTAGFVFDATPDACLTDAAKSAIVGQATISCGPVNAVLDNDTSTYPAGFWTTFKSGGMSRDVSAAFGTLAAPVIGDPMYSWQMHQTSFQEVEGNGFASVNMALESALPGTTPYSPWGFVLHASGAETGANAGNNTIHMGATGATTGGIFVYHLLTAGGGAGTATISMQDSADGSTGWTLVTGATTTALPTNGATTIPASGHITLATSTSVKRYLRWQLALATATSATFFAGFIRKQ
jgi:hypothetical protein